MKHVDVLLDARIIRLKIEAYTSRFNGFTCELMPRTSSEIIKVGMERVNRDINGARNILCFALADMPCIRNSTANVSES